MSDIFIDTTEVHVATTTADASVLCASVLPPSQFTTPGPLTRFNFAPGINDYGGAIASESMMSVPNDYYAERVHPVP